MSFHYFPKIVTDGLIFYVDASNPKSYDTTGTTWNDISNLRLTTYHRIYQETTPPKFEVNTTIQTWEWHRTNALSLGKTLAAISNAQENAMIQSMITRETFLGGRRIAYNTNNGTSLAWQWINGTSWIYTNWDTSEPENRNEEVVKIHTNGRWHDWPLAGYETHAVYMSYEDASWNAVNGYYGLAKNAYPSLNPLSSGVKAFTNITTRTRFTWPIASCCWSPQLLRFVGVGYLRATWSDDGINWTENFIANQDSRLNHNWNSICWSPELMLFVAVGDGKTMRSSNGITWIFTSEFATASWKSVCWSPELRLFVATGASGTNNRVITSPDGIDWTRQTGIPDNTWNNVCWSAELGIFIAASDGGTNIFMSSRNGINWTALGIPPNTVGVRGICWSKELGLFVAVTGTTSMISNNGLTWNSYSMNWSVYAWSICWIPELKLFVVPNGDASLLQLNTSHNGINWNPITYNGVIKSYRNVAWSPELGIFACLSIGGGNGAIHTALTSSLKVRPPTSYNVFDSSFNRIDENGKWDFSNINVTVLTAGGASVSSDDRLKHNEVVINNGLDVIDKLTPKFYKKTQVLLDASYNGDLSNYAWTLEAGLIAQELLKISDLSYVVSGGDYYEQTYKLITQTNTLSNSYYEPSANNYEVSNNLITQAYNVNYNSIFVYGLAAIKELHIKVKTQETSILDEQLNDLVSRIEALESNNNV